MGQGDQDPGTGCLVPRWVVGGEAEEGQPRQGDRHSLTLRPQSLDEALKYCNYVFTVVFVIEAVLKLVAFGFRRFFKDRYVGGRGATWCPEGPMVLLLGAGAGESHSPPLWWP